MVQYRVVKVLAALVLMGSAAHAEAPARAKAAPRAQPSSIKPRSTPAPKVVTPVPHSAGPKLVTPAPLLAPAPKLGAKAAAKAPVKLSAPMAAPVDADADADTVTDAGADGTTSPPAAPLTFVAGKPMTSAQLIVEYQRIGRDLMKLQELRGTDCTLDLWPRFRAIKLDEACKTPESRLDLESELKDLRGKIDRRHGVELSAECLNNPLAANCQ